jgi:hypothetical protein
MGSGRAGSGCARASYCGIEACVRIDQDRGLSPSASDSRPGLRSSARRSLCAAMRRRQMFEVNGTGPENAAWLELIRLLRELEGDAPVALDWSMDLGQSSVQTRC